MLDFPEEASLKNSMREKVNKFNRPYTNCRNLPSSHFYKSTVNLLLLPKELSPTINLIEILSPCLSLLFFLHFSSHAWTSPFHFIVDFLKIWTLSHLHAQEFME